MRGSGLAAVYDNRGTAYGKTGDDDHALADFNEAIRLDPKHVNAYNGRGNAYYDKGENDHAIADYNEAIGLDPNMPTPTTVEAPST